MVCRSETNSIRGTSNCSDNLPMEGSILEGTHSGERNRERNLVTGFLSPGFCRKSLQHELYTSPQVRSAHGKTHSSSTAPPKTGRPPKEV